jgi:methyl-accepting chemotaxis protein
MKLTDLRIGFRLGCSFGLVLLLMIALVLLGVSRLERLAHSIESITQDNNVQIKAVGEMRQAVLTIAFVVRDMALDSSVHQITAGVEQLAVARKRYLSGLETVKARIKSGAGKSLIEKISEHETVTVPLIDKAVALAQENRLDEVIPVLINEVQPNQKKWLGAMEEMLVFQEQLAEKSWSDAMEVYNSARILMGGIAVIALFLAGLTAWTITRSITNPLRQAVNIAQSVAKGDLTSNIETGRRDETGQLMDALKTMNHNLKKIVGEVRNGTDTITTASRRIAQGNVNLLSRTEDQSTALATTALLMENLTTSATKNADNANLANQLSLSASDVAGQGGKMVSDVIETMKSISDSAQRIANIIGVIDGIAFQTNILALNAAVEAARAGEKGRGFAVVAAEVRTLAHRSATAALEIKELINESLTKVDKGGELVEQAGETIKNVITSVKRVSEIVTEVTAASQEQRSGITEVNHALLQMRNVTQQNTEQAEDAAAAAQSLEDEAAILVKTVSLFALSDTFASPALERPAISAYVASQQSSKHLRPPQNRL